MPLTAATDSENPRGEMKKQGGKSPSFKDGVTACSSTNLAKKTYAAKERTSLTNKNAKPGNDANATNKDPVKKANKGTKAA